MDPILVTSVIKDTTNAPILIIDHQGGIGLAMCERIKEELSAVFVSSKQPEVSSNIIYIPYKHRFPEIPNGLYSCIIFVSHHEKDLPELVKKSCAKAKEDGVPFVFVCEYRSINENLVQRIVNFYEQSFVVIVGELFGQGDSALDQYIIQAGTTRSITLPQMGLRKVYPVLFTDTIQGILHSVFGIQRHNRITYLYQQHPMTDLSIAHVLQKKDPLIHIDFLKNKKKEAEEKKPALHGFYYFDEKYPLQEKLLDAYTAASVLRKEEDTTYIHKEEFKPILELDAGNSFSLVPENAPVWIKKSLLYLFILLVFPYICLAFFGILGGIMIALSQQALGNGGLDTAKTEITIAYGSLIANSYVSMPVLFELRLLNLGGVAYQLDKKIMIGKEASGSVVAILNSSDIVKNILVGKSSDPETDASSVVSNTSSALITLQNLLVANPDDKDLANALGKYRRILTLGGGTIGLLPDALAVNGKHTYLILFEDNNELRPGGGLITAYGVVTFDHGKMENLSIHDVYDADDKLHQHVDPQFALRRYMGVIHLYLHDSNFDVDFVADAKKASEIYQLETGQKIDGVVGVDLAFMQMLLSATGPISVPQSNITVNDQNFLTVVEQHAIAPGSSQKDSFLLNSLSAIQTDIENQHFAPQLLFQSFIDGLGEKHVLFALANIPDQNALTVNHVSSSLWDPREGSSGTINDFIGISEANVGSNKVNYYIKRSMKQSVSIDGEGNLTGTMQLTYTNTSNSGVWPGGDYKNYLRIILPQDTSLQSIAFDGQTQATQSAITDPIIYEAQGFRAPQTLEVEQTREEGKMVYGFLVTIPATTTREVTITYSHDQKINLANPVLHYRLSLYKQPGAGEDPYSLAFNFPLAYTILSATPSNQDGNSDYSLYTKLSTDQMITVDLTKK